MSDTVKPVSDTFMSKPVSDTFMSDTFTKGAFDRIFDRREFLGAGAALAAAALPAASLIPASPAAAAITGPECLADWTIDDQWMGYPRYAEAIACGRPRQSLQKPRIHPADEPFVPR